MKMKPVVLTLAIVSLFSIGHSASAAVSADEAARLKSTLTPLGGERGGNKEGTIPSWDGTTAKVVAKLATGASGDSFADEKPKFQITAQNASQYAGKLSEGTLALLKKYPTTFRLDVYPTHRTAVAPQYVYDNTFRNATHARLTANGGIEGAYGGIPFPIPRSGAEVIWNHILHPRIGAIEYGFQNVVGSANGQWSLASRAENANQTPYYAKDGSPEKWNGDYLLARFTNTDPPFKAGEALVIRDSANPENSRQAWQYLVGQRRVRRAPTVGYDTPDFVASGANYFDEVIGFYGHPDRYEWKLIEKREMYIPYNTNGFQATPLSEAFVPHHFNPDKVRWELHRVWEVEATVASGKRHVVPKRKFYFDEDTFAVAAIDGYDAEGKLWRASLVLPVTVPEYPIVLSDTAFIFNLQANTFSCIQCVNGQPFKAVPNKPDSFFTGEALGSTGLR